MKNYLLFILLAISSFSFAQNNCVTFNGLTNSADLGTAITANGSYTKMAWIKCNDWSVTRQILSNQFAVFSITTGKLSAGHGLSPLKVQDPATLSLNTWTFVAVTYDAPSDSIKLYKNGVLVSKAGSAGGHAAGNIILGASYLILDKFNGSMDEVCLWNRALSAAEIKHYCTHAPLNNATGLLSRYDCNEASGLNLLNLCTNGSPITGLLAVASRTTSPIQFTGNALSLDGSNDYVSLPNTLVSGTFTVEFWMKTTATGAGSASSAWYSGSGICDAEQGGVTNDWGISLTGDRLAFGVGNPDITLHSTAAVNTGAWIHVAASWSTAGEMKLYINGVLDASATGTATATRNVVTPRIGSIQTGSNFYLGSIDELRIWATARTQAQIQANMNKEINAAVEADLKAYYSFNQGTAAGTNTGLNVLLDTKGDANGAMVNFALTGSISNFIVQNLTLVTLPVKWESFTAKLQNKSVLLNWSVSAELNVKDYSVERSADGIRWISIGRLNAGNSSQGISQYQFTDAQPLSGSNYYRILQTDLDGKYGYSKTAVVSLAAATTALKILSNPVVDKQLRFQLGSGTVVRFVNSTGQEIWNKKLGAGTHQIDISGIAQGLYFLTTNTEKVSVLVNQ